MKPVNILLISLFAVIACEKENNDSNLVTDIDGNVYQTVTIGAQVWLVENLQTTRYNDGTDIPLVTDNIAWNALNTPGYCWYDNDKAAYKNTYGALYNWYTVENDKLCPSGWHVATYGEWEQLVDYAGGISEAGGMLKEAGITHWNHPNADATNETGFTALPGGYRKMDGTFLDRGMRGCFWSSTEFNTEGAWGSVLDNNNPSVYSNTFQKKLANSVRCIKD